MKDYDFFETFLKQAELSLLYRGSRDGWMGKDFHSRCDLKGPTLTLIQILDSDCIGGFSRSDWVGKVEFRSFMNLKISKNPKD